MHLTHVGVPEWTDDEQAFARECQANMDLPRFGLSSDVIPPSPRWRSAARRTGRCQPEHTDDGRGQATALLGVSMHTWPVTACGGTDRREVARRAAAQVLALTALDVLTDEALETSHVMDFERRTEGFEYVADPRRAASARAGYRLPATPP